MVKPIIVSSRGAPLFWWNLDSNVGAGSPNKADDVQIVQFGYVCMSKNPRNKATLSAAERAAIANIEVGKRCTGTEDDPLVVAIRTHERSRGGAQDGHVSVAPLGQILYDGKHSFIINVLVTNIMEVTRSSYPRFFGSDDLKNSPELVRVVKQACAAA